MGYMHRIIDIGNIPQIRAMQKALISGFGYAAMFLEELFSLAYGRKDRILPAQNFDQESADMIISAPYNGVSDDRREIINSVVIINAITPYVPMWESFMILRIFSLLVSPPKPSKKSARPSS